MTDSLEARVKRVAELNAKRTPGEWVFDSERANSNNEDVAIYLKNAPLKNGYIDLDYEIVGFSEWIRIKDDDGEFIAHAPAMASLIAELWEELERLRKG